MIRADHFANTSATLARLDRRVEVRQGAIEGAAWLGSAQVAAQALQFAFSILNARLLAPDDFGLAAIVLAVIWVLASIVDFGLGSSIVHHEKPDDELTSTVFWMSFGTACLLVAALVLLARPLSELLDTPALEGLIYVSAVSLPAASTVVQVALLERTFNFKPIAFATLSGMTVGLATVPIAALAGMGPYSLVLGPLLQCVVVFSMLWWLAGWKPTQRPSAAAARHVWRYSRGIGGYGLLQTISRGSDAFALARTVGPAELGQYNRSFNLTTAPVQQMQQAVDRSIFPALSRLRADPARMGQAWFRGVAAAAAAMLPVVVTLGLTAPSLVRVLYGEAWLPMIPILQILAVAAFFQMLVAASPAVYRAADRGGQLFWSGCVSAVLTVGAVFIGSRWGAEGVATAVAVKSMIDVLLFVVPVFWLVPIGASFALSLLPRMLLPSLALAIGQIFVGVATGLGPGFPLFVLSLAAGGFFYGFAMWRLYPAIVSSAVRRLPTRRTRTHV